MMWVMDTISAVYLTGCNFTMRGVVQNRSQTMEQLLHADIRVSFEIRMVAVGTFAQNKKYTIL